MQFLVFAAFAIVLSLPEDGVPWRTLCEPQQIAAVIAAQIFVPTLLAMYFSKRVKQRLDRDPAWLPAAQRALNQGNSTIRFALFAGLIGNAYLTNFSTIVRHWPPLNNLFGLDEVIILLPFFMAIVLAWTAIYPADRAVRQVALEMQLWMSGPVRPVWRLRRYLSFMLRQHVLIIAAPMLPILVVNDVVASEHYGRLIRQYTHLAWADQAVLVLFSGLVFLIAPVMLAFIWHTKPLPHGELRERLDAICRRIGLRYRRILIWQSDGMVVNAAVMGIARPVRYILLSDGLLEMMDDRQIEAVFGHEAGHVKHRHIQFYLLFAMVSMFIVGGITELLMRWGGPWFQELAHQHDYLQVGGMLLIVLVWLAGFGVVSRRFEWQADLFGAQSITPTSHECDRPCFVHHTAIAPPPEPGEAFVPVCATAADIFAQALQRIAMLNGIPTKAKSWRHASIAHRMNLLRQYAIDPTLSGRLERSVMLIKAVLLVGSMTGMAMTIWLYWPE